MINFHIHEKLGEKFLGLTRREITNPRDRPEKRGDQKRRALRGRDRRWRCEGRRGGWTAARRRCPCRRRGSRGTPIARSSPRPGAAEEGSSPPRSLAGQPLNWQSWSLTKTKGKSSATESAMEKRASLWDWSLSPLLSGG